ncbi:MAG: amidohydrolase family protein [Pseudomonadota bacterium]
MTNKDPSHARIARGGWQQRPAPRWQDARRTLFINAQIFDGSGSALFPGEVLVVGNRIEAVAAGGESIEREGAAVIDCDGATLMPGLVESHGHLSWPSSVGRVINAMHLPAEEHLLVTAYNARVTLDHGFTSVYSAGALGARLEIALKQEIAGGYLPGPRLRSSSLEKAANGVAGVPQAHDGDHGEGVPALRAYIAAMAGAGIDSVKFLLSSDDGFAPGAGQQLMYTEQEVAAIGMQARESGVWLACHAQAAEAVKQAVRHGFRSIYHCSYADAEALDLLESRKDEIFVSPAAGMLYARQHEAQAFGITPEVAERMGATSGLLRMREIYPEMKRRGIRVLPGGDYGFPYNPVGRNARDLDLFVRLFGFSPCEALMAATKWGGQLMDLQVGLVTPGYLADLLLVDGDPSADVTVLQDRNRLLMIMQDGKYHKWPLVQGDQ